MAAPMHAICSLPCCDTFMAHAVQVLGSKLLVMKSCLPTADIQNLASRFPMLLTDYNAEELVEKTDQLRSVKFMPASMSKALQMQHGP